MTYAKHLRNRIQKDLDKIPVLRDLIKATETDPRHTDRTRKKLLTQYSNNIKQLEGRITTLTNLLETAYGEKL